MDVRALVFDVFGTVVDWRDGVAREVRRLLPGVDAEAFADAWRERYAPSMDRVRRGEREWANLDALHRESLDALLVEYAQDPDEETRAELVLAWHRLDPWPDAVAGLTRLRERFVLAHAVQRQRGPARRHGQARGPAVGRRAVRGAVRALQAGRRGVRRRRPAARPRPGSRC